MGITPGKEWGSEDSYPEDFLVINSNQDLWDILESHKRSNEMIPVIGLAGGDLWRTLGGTRKNNRLNSEKAQLFTVDIGSALLDGHIYWFASHLIARSPLWLGRSWIAANAAHRKSWNIAPRAHPGDGLLDVLDSNLNFSDLVKAKSRMQTGTHVPHPDINYRRIKSEQTNFSQKTDIWLDDVKVVKAKEISVRVEPDALRVML